MTMNHTLAPKAPVHDIAHFCSHFTGQNQSHDTQLQRGQGYAILVYLVNTTNDYYFKKDIIWNQMDLGSNPCFAT